MKDWIKRTLGVSAMFSALMGASHGYDHIKLEERKAELEQREAVYEQRVEELKKRNPEYVSPASKGEFISPVTEPDEMALKKMENTPPTGDEIKLVMYYANKFLKYRTKEINSEYILPMIRNNSESLYYDHKSGYMVIDFTKINPNLSQVISQLSKRYGRNEKLMHAFALVESAYGFNHTSKKGAKTPFQVMPDTKNHHFPNSEDDWSYYQAAFKEPSIYEKYFKGKINLSGKELTDFDILFAAASYNAGMGRLKRNSQDIFFGGGDFKNQTQPYMLKMLSALKFYKFKVLDENGNEKLI